MGTLKVGAGKAVINPSEDLFPLGKFEAVKDDVHVRALVVENDGVRFLLLEYEPGHPPAPEFKKEISERYSIPEELIITTSIHNHSSCDWGINAKKIPGMSAPIKMPPEALRKALEFEEIVRKGTWKAVDDALNALRPARYGYGEGSSYINCNKDWLQEDGHYTEGMAFDGDVDRTLSVLKFEDEEGNLISVLLNYPCQESVANGSLDVDGKVKFTPAFPGYACNYIEKRYGNGSVVLWTCGTAGDLGAIFSAACSPREFDPEDGFNHVIPLPPGSGYIIQRYLGELHAIDALKVLKDLECTETDMPIRCTTGKVELEGQDVPEGADMFANFAKINNSLAKMHPELCDEKGRPLDDRRVQMVKTGTVDLNMQLVMLGDIAYVGFAGEPYVEIGMQCKAASPARHTVIIAPTSRDSAEFIVSDGSADHDSFQTFSRVYKGNNNKPIIDGMLKMFAQLRAD
ncbi:MAG: hypothetical protein IJ091_06730 [Oscillospiraceae bacterium]|nr:hypothetical protein [Oscillospiraceae bacterium]